MIRGLGSALGSITKFDIFRCFFGFGRLFRLGPRSMLSLLIFFVMVKSGFTMEYLGGTSAFLDKCRLLWIIYSQS